MILSDNTITDLCVPSSQFYYHFKDGDRNLVSRRYKNTNLSNVPVIGTAAGTPLREFLVELSKEENDHVRNEFSPMIAPFIDHQVKTRPMYKFEDEPITTLVDSENVVWGVSDIPKLESLISDPFKAPELIAQFTKILDFLRKIPKKEPQLEKYDQRILSYGLSSAGYDVRLDTKFKIFTNVKSVVIDPLNMSDDCYVDYEGEECIIPPNSYVLGVTIEEFNIPRDVAVIALGKSTLARAGCVINVTPIEPGFKGKVVIEISNATPLPMKIYANMGIAQFIFHKLDQSCKVSYADRGGKYQNQSGLQTAIV